MKWLLYNVFIISMIIPINNNNDQPSGAIDQALGQVSQLVSQSNLWQGDSCSSGSSVGRSLAVVRSCSGLFPFVPTFTSCMGSLFPRYIVNAEWSLVLWSFRIMPCFVKKDCFKPTKIIIIILIKMKWKKYIILIAFIDVHTYI